MWRSIFQHFRPTMLLVCGWLNCLIVTGWQPLRYEVLFHRAGPQRLQATMWSWIRGFWFEQGLSTKPVLLYVFFVVVYSIVVFVGFFFGLLTIRKMRFFSCLDVCTEGHGVVSKKKEDGFFIFKLIVIYRPKIF